MKLFLLGTELLNGHPALLENLTYQMVGILVVITSLGSLWVCIAMLGRLLVRPLPGVATPAPAGGSRAVEGSGITPEVCAAITAAVVSSLGPDQIVRSIKPASPFVQAWSLEGRRQIFQSHKLR